MQDWMQQHEAYTVVRVPPVFGHPILSMFCPLQLLPFTVLENQL
ncbi:hypothetical protein L798_07811 [Zootermopsis nevadensis]|uniref:Uncharacterized protein n=1 Tax=Zootermopsis nevadensis TaxID=136037 RepID=A0A067RG42_ZOONE|nr:hypothetical protein L798_07811 [Zootermopsis nevadensis]